MNYTEKRYPACMGGASRIHTVTVKSFSFTYLLDTSLFRYLLTSRQERVEGNTPLRSTSSMHLLPLSITACLQ
ncbi:hypothetical protein CSUI_007992 [Cystoisospora suis]|uniref:Uncharacterized protein n=1 Tax=Cystoisospora suis TaxID=483139 RepID=A0A2C6KNU2_9APIC|nr:hypothetical protein CSUI_007992 [Cystoisospora suis]